MIRQWSTWALGVLAACCSAVLLAHAYVGSSSRFMADTYCYAASAKDYGLLVAQRLWYQNWTGRYSFNLAESLVGLGGPRLAPLLPSLVLLLWAAALIAALIQLKLASRPLASFLAALLLTTLILSLTLSDIPQVAQSLYWSNGMNNYIPPLVLSAFYAGVLIYCYHRPAPSKTAAILSIVFVALIAFVAGGFSETYDALQLSALMCVLLAFLVFGSPTTRRNLLPLCAAGLLGSALALAIVFVAPGNKVRAASFPPPPHLPALIRLSLQLTGNFLQDSLSRYPVGVLAAVLIPAALGSGWLLGDAATDRLSVRDWVRILLWTPIVTWGLLLSAFAAAAYGLSGAPPGRTLVVPQFFLTVGLTAWGFALGAVIRKAGLGSVLGREASIWKVALGCALVVCGFNSLHAAQLTLATKPAFEAYAQAWDVTNHLIQDARSRGITRISMPPLVNPAGLEEAGADSNFWVNQCVSNYYRLAVVANLPLPAPAPAQLARMTPLDGRIGDVARIEGYALDKDIVRAGETLSLTVYWRPQASTQQPYTVFVHLYDPASGSIAQVDSYPAQGKYPTTNWVYDHIFADTYLLTVPSQFAASRDAEIVIGLYDLKTMQRLPVAGADAQADQSWIHFGKVRINP